MLFFIPLLSVATLLQALIPGAPTPETFVPMGAAARGTDVSLWILQQCPSTMATLAELELALQLGSSNALVYLAPLGLHVWQPSPALRAWGHYLALVMAQIGLPSPVVLTLPTPALVLSLPAPSLVLTLPAPRPILSLPAPAPILALPAPKPILSITALEIVLSSPKPTRTLPTPKSIFTQPPVKASPTSDIVPTFSTPNLEVHVPPSPGPMPSCARPTSAVSMAPPLLASNVSVPPSTPTREFYPAATKPIVHSTISKWYNHLVMACLVVLALSFHLAARHSFKGLVRHLVGANYPLDGEIPGEHNGLGHALGSFGGLATGMSDTARSGMLSGLSPGLFGVYDQPEPVDAALGDGISGEHGGLGQALDPFDKLAIDAFDMVRSGVKSDRSDEPLEPNGAMAMADATSRTVSLQTGLEEPDQPESGPSNLEPEREGAQDGGSGTASSRWAPQSEDGWGGGYRGGRDGGNRGGWGGGGQSDGWNQGGWNGGRGGGYSGGSVAYSGAYGRRGGYSGGRGGYGNGGNGGGSYRGSGGEGREGRNSNRRESKATYFFRLRQEKKGAAREPADS